MTLHQVEALVSTMQNFSLHIQFLVKKILIILNINIFKYNVEVEGLTRFTKSPSSMTVRAISLFLNFEPSKKISMSTMFMITGIVQNSALKTPQSCGIVV